jgi:hypothetical protein
MKLLAMMGKLPWRQPRQSQSTSMYVQTVDEFDLGDIIVTTLSSLAKIQSQVFAINASGMKAP